MTHHSTFVFAQNTNSVFQMETSLSVAGETFTRNLGNKTKSFCFFNE